ncbi:MAG: acyltransferase [Oscillospiraceae bacterium]|jgi:maltose O-acetyltransferase|nr:acyltransferase [Oscillospiraceae bacterium]
MKVVIRRIVAGVIYVFFNYFVNNIPAYWLRRLLYCVAGMKIGRGSRLAMKVIVFLPWKIRIGANTMVNEYTILDGRGGLEIGDNVSISMFAIIYSASHKAHSDTFESFKEKVNIDDNVWIGARAIVLPGSRLSKGSVLAAGSSFTGETEENGIYAGVPATFRKMRAISDSYRLGRHLYFFK